MARTIAVAALILVALMAPTSAQPVGSAGFVILNQERILTGSTRGKALLAEEETAREALRAEARTIETAFEDEERRLTEERGKLDATAFRVLADDFDARVVAARREQDARAGALALEFDQKRRQFYAEVGPILVGLMERLGASAIFDETSVLLADQALNVTDEVIGEIDRAGAVTPPDGAVPAGAAPAGADPASE